MKSKKFLSVLLPLMLLASCGQTVQPETSSPASDDTSSQGSSNDEDLTKVDKSHLPYVSNLDSYKKSDWKGKWIWIKKKYTDVYAALRKTFTLDEVPTSAIASMACSDKGYLYVNGQLAVVDGPSKKGMTDVDTYYQNYDLAKYLKKGTNTLTFIVNFIGASSKSQNKNEKGGLLFELPLPGQTIVSDSSFKVKLLDEYESQRTLKGNWPSHPSNSTFVAEKNVYYNSTKAAGDITSSDFDDSSWDDATIVGTPGYEPFNDTYLDIAEPFGFTSVQDATDTNGVLNKKFTEKTTVTFDLPENIQYMPYIELTSDEAGKVITLYSNTYMSDSASFMDDYVTSAGAQSYQQLSWRTGYKILLDVPAGVTLTKVGYIETFYDSEVIGSFTSSDSFLDTLYEKSANTLKICMRDTYMDCPDRERSPYAGDGANQITESLYSLDEKGIKLAKKTLVSLLGWMSTKDTVKGEDARIMPSRWPSNDTKEIPVQNLAFINMTKDYLMLTGDTETVSAIYPIYKDYLNVWSMNSDGLINYRAGAFTWTDWGDKIDSELLQNEFYYLALDAMQTMANELGLSSNDDIYSSRKESIKVGMQKYYTSEGYKDQYLDDRANAMAVVTGIADESQYDTILSVLNNVKNASPYMERYVQEAFCKMGEYDKLIERIHDRYADMVNDEASTLWEKWDKTDGTINHGWTGGSIITFARDFLGLKAKKQKYEEYELNPITALSNYKITVPTVKGNIVVDYSSKDSTTSISITTIGTKGTIYLPKSLGENISVTGDSYEQLESSSDSYAFSLTGKNYTFAIS